MKLMKQNRTEHVLPDDSTVCEILLRMERPFQVMAWMMVETAARISDLQALRVRDVNRDNKTLLLEQGGVGRMMNLSAGLMDAIDPHLTALREVFEKNKRWSFSSRHAASHEVQMFADQLLFPVWMLPGHARASLHEPVPVAEFVRAIQNAASESGYEGMIQSNTLRLFCTLRWLAQGMDVANLHVLLGHRDMMTTLLMVQALKYGGLTFASCAESSIAWTSATMVA